MAHAMSSDDVRPSYATELCHALAHTSPFPTAMVDGLDHVVRYVNPALCLLVGEPAERLLGRHVVDALPQCRGCASIMTEVSRSGKARSHRERGVSAKEPRFWAYSVWPLLATGGRSLGALIQVTEASELQSQSAAMNEALMVSAVRQHELAEAADVLAAEMSNEITQRKKTEASLSVSESRLRLALESARATTWEWNIKTNMLVWSDEISALSGVDVRSREESFESWRSLIYPEDHDAVDAVAELAVNSSSRIAVEFRILDVYGVIRWMLLRGCLNRVEDGRALTYTGIILDITERKHAEHALLRSEKLAGVGRLAATLAHEINNPLDAAMNALYLAQTNPNVPESALEYLAMADEELQRVAHMTRQSLGFYREATSPTTFPVDTLLDSVLGLMKNRIVAKSITIDRQSDKALEATGIFGELRQVMVNLIANSLDALDIGGRIRLRTSLTSSFKNDGQRHIRITVADNGRGVGATQLARIFEPFFTTKGELGNGLGLWVTKQILEKHSGKITVRSKNTGPQSGTVFSITLPE